MTRHHTIISGTGRADTTFLVELLTQLGLDTQADKLGYSINAHAGLEADITLPNAPYIVKNP